MNHHTGLIFHFILTRLLEKKLHIFRIIFQKVSSLERCSSIYIINFGENFIKQLEPRKYVQKYDILNNLIDFRILIIGDVPVSDSIVDTDAEERHSSKHEWYFIDYHLCTWPITVNHHNSKISTHGENHQRVSHPVKQIKPLTILHIGEEYPHVTSDWDNLNNFCEEDFIDG